MIKRLPRYAEVELARLCAKAGALCHAVDEDESGWDRLIEFPEEDFSGPVDTRPPRLIAYVQVKSVVKESLTCQVKLSNALRAALSPQPWFIVLITGETSECPSRVFAVHIWDKLIRRTLEAARRAHNEGQQLHKRRLKIKFRQENEKGEALLQWMNEAIHAVGPAYESAKRSINQTAGYERGYGIAELTIEAKSENEILQNFLGLGDGLRIDKFTFTPSRFGIASPKPQIDESSGIIHISPQPAGEVEIRLRRPAGSRPIVLNGHAFGLGLPGIPDHQKRVRFSAGFMEVLCGPGAYLEASAHLDGDEKHSLATIQDYVALNEWLEDGPVEMQVWAEGRRVLGRTVNRGNSSLTFDLRSLSSALRLLRSLAGDQNPEIRLKDLYGASGLATFSDIADAASLQLQLDRLAYASLEPFTSILYWFHIDVGNLSFFGMAEWPVVEDVVIDVDKRRVTARSGRIVESYFLQDPSDFDREVMERDYERRKVRLARGGVPLGLGDLRSFICASAGTRSAAN